MVAKLPVVGGLGSGYLVLRQGLTRDAVAVLQTQGARGDVLGGFSLRSARACIRSCNTCSQELQSEMLER